MSAARLPLRVLLVDDQPLIRAGLRLTLQHHFPELRLHEAGGATEALARISALTPELVLLDVNLPGVNGLDLARQIRATPRPSKVLMVAADVDPWTVHAALGAGASGFIAKSQPADLVVQAIQAVLNGDRFLCPEAQSALARAEAHGEADVKTPGPAVLSPREREVLRYLAHGENTKQVAALLQISPKTVETHRQHIARKLGLHSVAALVRYAIRHNLVGA